MKKDLSYINTTPINRKKYSKNNSPVINSITGNLHLKKSRFNLHLTFISISLKNPSTVSLKINSVFSTVKSSKTLDFATFFGIFLSKIATEKYTIF